MKEAEGEAPFNLDEDSMEEVEGAVNDDDDEIKKESIEDEDDSDETDESESEEIDSLDEEEAEMRKNIYLHDMTDLEKQFVDLKEQLFKERITQIEGQLEQVNNSEAQEYTGPLKQLEDEFISRNEIAEHLKYYKTINLDNKLKCELQAHDQNFKNEEWDVIETLRIDVEEKLRKIDEERQNADMYSDLWSDDLLRCRKKRKGMDISIPERRKKPLAVSGPYVIYMLKDLDIMEDWSAIRKERKSKAKLELARKKALEIEEDPMVTARFENGKFFYKGDWFQKGEKVTLDNHIDDPVLTTISGINMIEVWVSKAEGVKCKLAISQFQKGKYVMRRAIPVEVT